MAKAKKTQTGKGAKRKAVGLGEAHAKVKEVLLQEKNGLRLFALSRRTGIPHQELARHLLELAEGCNLIECDRSSKRWVLRGIFGIGGKVRPLQAVS